MSPPKEVKTALSVTTDYLVFRLSRLGFGPKVSDFEKIGRKEHRFLLAEDLENLKFEARGF
jgi:hypothetical protein